jgi:hypothetical protein
MTDESRVAFLGEGPFSLPGAQRARADGESNGVTMTLYCLIPEQGPNPQAVRVQMTYSVALELASSLASAAHAAEIAQRKGV